MLSLALHFSTNHATFQDVPDLVNVTLPMIEAFFGTKPSKQASDT